MEPQSGSPRAEPVKKTDWNSYYQQPHPATTFTRSITAARLIHRIGQAMHKSQYFRIAELGGANSCFYERVIKEFRPSEYHIVDNNRIGLDKLQERQSSYTKTIFHEADILNFHPNFQVDLVFSVGLIEHFDTAATRKAIEAHFRILRKGGIAVITFPTPTFLYRLVRKFIELLGMWIFHDERPLKREEVLDAVSPFGDVQTSEIIWPILLTQGLVVVQKAI